MQNILGEKFLKQVLTIVSHFYKELGGTLQLLTIRVFQLDILDQISGTLLCFLWGQNSGLAQNKTTVLTTHMGHFQINSA